MAPPPLLEYWKPPKPAPYARIGVRDYERGIPSAQQRIPEPSSYTESRSRGSNRLIPKPVPKTVFASNDDKFSVPLKASVIVTKSDIDMTFKQHGERGATQKEMDRRIPMVDPLPTYNASKDDADEKDPYLFDVRYWSKEKISLCVIGLLIVIIIIVAVAVVEIRKNRYPDYSKLAYSKVDQFYGTSFFDNFDYFSGYDPTSGFVHYLDVQQAAISNLTYATSTSAVLKVDTTQANTTTGRYSVRVTSKKTWDTGLFIFDVLHTPYGCATWPALWMTSADLASWPKEGEIDIMESVNNATTGNQMTLHSTDGCSMSVKRKETGTILSSNCYNGTNNNAGCGVQGTNATFGPEFNSAGGGIMAVELRSAGIRMWQFGRSSIPSDITNENPDPSTWGTALADFPDTDCDIGKHFKNQSIVVDIDLCGTWAGQVDIYGETCPGLCTDYVAQNPIAFTTAYWEFGNFTIYQSS